MIGSKSDELCAHAEESREAYHQQCDVFEELARRPASTVDPKPSEPRMSWLPRFDTFGTCMCDHDAEFEGRGISLSWRSFVIELHFLRRAA